MLAAALKDAGRFDFLDRDRAGSIRLGFGPPGGGVFEERERGRMPNEKSWAAEFPGLEAAAGESVRVEGEEWHRDGRHRYRLELPLGSGSPLAKLRERALAAGVRAQWDKNVGQLQLSSSHWGGQAELAQLPGLREPCVFLYVERRATPEQAAAGAPALARSMAALAPFVELADRQGATFEIVVRLEYPGARNFGYLKLVKSGWQQFLSAELDGWLQGQGFARAGAEGRSWTRAGAPPVEVTLWDSDSLRVDLAGMEEFFGTAAPSAGKVPDRDRVLARARALASLVRRFWLEHGWKSSKAKERASMEGIHDALLDSLRAGALLAALTWHEQRLMFAPLGGWVKTEVLNVSWRVEELGTLAWALGLLDALPPVGEQLSMSVMDLLPPLAPLPIAASASRLRGPAEIEAMDRELQKWRAREGSSDEGSTVRSVVLERTSALRWLREGGEPRTEEGSRG